MRIQQLSAKPRKTSLKFNSSSVFFNHLLDMSSLLNAVYDLTPSSLKRERENTLIARGRQIDHLSRNFQIATDIRYK